MTEATIFWIIIPSTALPDSYQCHTSTMSCAESIQTMFPPLPMAAKLDARPVITGTNQAVSVEIRRKDAGMVEVAVQLRAG